MDLSFWTNSTPQIKFAETKKKFFGQYLYKMVASAPSGRLILDKKDRPMQELLEERRARSKPFHHYFQKTIMRTSEPANAVQLEYYRLIYKNYKDSIKFRIEEPFLTIYSDDIKILEVIANGDTEHITELHTPADNTVELLNRGEIILKKPTEYNYKVVFKESHVWDGQTREQVYSFLTEQADEVKMTKGLEHNLLYKKIWFSSSYFYCKSEQTITMLSLMAHSAIAGIYKIAKLEQ